ncbi:hypothetical protein SFR_7061 (plasmid) [Streptomyces sp. FR-008]|nr:hypothetical protein SFR_7061 [Streptomyces sp. FR-008]
MPHTPRRAAPAGPLPDLIRDRVAAALTEAGGDADVAQAALIKRAVPDVMALFAASRVGGRYEHSEFPPTPASSRSAARRVPTRFGRAGRSGVRRICTALLARATSPWR